MQVKLQSNPSDLSWIVQKYGGTSVGKFLNEIVEDIIPKYLKTNRVAIVCSARSGDTKEKGTTNRLLEAVEKSLEESDEYQSIVNTIRNDHIKTARSIIKNPEILLILEIQLKNEFIKLSSFLEAAKIIGEVSPRSRDVIVGMGEKLSCIVITAVLKDRGIDSQLVPLNDIIHQEFTHLDQTFYDYVSNRINRVLHGCGDSVPVLTGFFGPVPGGLLSKIGRGYTDLCAALTAVGLKSEELQIWKEVDGIFTVDPHKVSTSRLLPIISPEEAAELSYYGSEVIHPFTMEQIIRAEIPVRIKNVMNPSGPGSIIFPEKKKLVTCGIFTQPLEDLTQCRMDSSGNRPTAVTVKDKICVVNVKLNHRNRSHIVLAKLFGILDKYHVPVDLVSTSNADVSLALSSKVAEKSLRQALMELKDLGMINVTQNMVIVSLIGKHMKDTIGVASEMFTSLAESGINIEIISQGASKINISCVVKEKHALTALQTIHRKLLDVDSNIEHVTNEITNSSL
ncbi:hypothetical protein G6F46_010418 [Rhizopus delemar]|uniref:Aspartokinase n=2 Tax=Rhizopus TaxID=4842 RepID=A0A9P6Z327_9FUNG|nr:hypothetical protein G6F55_010229 [Rhizopus delemar]KAG1537293.1 hypothetical protein G6F51_010457 [Rhizopus arrhizus]KAG1495760.1 hypothetical protein G6F54_006953 [Rhizopus delemar]KAG1509656.1 hypothetical protein G6F53_007276 [Rhizopus delemar]KAG1519663.1 hypothetical protein G6F52_008402 [Rhizopus delemar]